MASLSSAAVKPSEALIKVKFGERKRGTLEYLDKHSRQPDLYMACASRRQKAAYSANMALAAGAGCSALSPKSDREDSRKNYWRSPEGP